MTDRDEPQPLPSPSAPPACGFGAQRAAYLSGALDGAAADAFEAHLAICPPCEAAVEPGTRLDLERHMPTVPASVRGAVLESIAPQPPRRVLRERRGSGWLAGVALVAAALLVMVMRRGADPTRTADTAVAIAAESLAIDADVPDMGAPRNAMLGTAAKLARDPSLAEFRALDDATRELEAALTEAPADRDVREQLAAIRARRAELTEKMKEAAS